MIKKLFIIFVMWFVIHIGVMLYFGIYDDINASDAAVVFGNQADDDGNPAERLQSRLNCAIELYKEKYFRFIIVSGAFDKKYHDETKTMIEYLSSKGIPEDRIIQDNAGTNTYQTALNLRVIERQHDIKSVLVISQYYHILRVKLAMSKVGIANVSHAHAMMSPESRDSYYIPREFAAFYTYLLFK
jgi:vancomycin permeability regulator SanA